MQIFVRTHLSEEPIALDVESSDTINVVRAKLQDKERLMFGMEQLVDGTKTLTDYNIEEGSTLRLVPRAYRRPRRRRGGIEIFVMNCLGNNMKFEVDGSDTVIELKEMVESREGIPVDQLRFIFNSRQLEDDRTLAEYNVQQGSTIHYVLRLRGS